MFTARKGLANCSGSKFQGLQSRCPVFPRRVDGGGTFTLTRGPRWPQPQLLGGFRVEGPLCAPGSAGTACHPDVPAEWFITSLPDKLFWSSRNFNSVVHPPPSLENCAYKVFQKSSPPRPSGRKVNLVHTDTILAYILYDTFQLDQEKIKNYCDLNLIPHL